MTAHTNDAAAQISADFTSGFTYWMSINVMAAEALAVDWIAGERHTTLFPLPFLLSSSNIHSLSSIATNSRNDRNG